MPRLSRCRALALLGPLATLVLATTVIAQSPYGSSDPYRPNDAYRPGDTYRPNDQYGADDVYRPGTGYPAGRPNDAYVPPGRDRPYGAPYGGADEDRRYSVPSAGYGTPYQPAPGYGAPPYGSGAPPYGSGPGPYDDRYDRRTYSRNEIIDTGHRFFGSVSQGLAGVVEYAFNKAGRPNGYILGEDLGGAFIAGLRYGEGTLYTKDAGLHKVFWQGPSFGYDMGAEGARTMVLVYNLRDPSEIYNRFGGVEGSAYFIGGVSIQFQKHGDVVLAPIRSGVGLRLGANVGYLKYTRTPTWNPF